MIPACSLAATLFVLAAPTPQNPDPEIVARYHIGERPAVVTKAELAIEVARRFRHTDSGEEALELLINRYLVETAATRAGVTPSAADIQARTDEFREAMVAQGSTLEASLASKRMSWDDFIRNFVSLSIAHEQLVMKELGLTSRDAVTPARLQLWLKEARSARTIETDSAKLSGEVVARIDDRSFQLVDLGRILLPNTSEEDVEKFVRRIVLANLVDARAKELEIVVTEEDTAAEIERRRERIESDPRFGGIGYDAWLLQTRGMTPLELARSEQMVATVQQERIVAKLHPDEQLRERLESDREAVLRRHGARRALSIVLIRALDKPNDIVTRDFDAARQMAIDVRTEIVDEGRPFAEAARVHSEDPYSKVRGGDYGQFHREDTGLPEEVLAAAFALPPLGVSAPIRVPSGYLLVRVDAVEPTPSDQLLIERLRDQLGQDLLEELLEAARLERS